MSGELANLHASAPPRWCNTIMKGTFEGVTAATLWPVADGHNDFQYPH